MLVRLDAWYAYYHSHWWCRRRQFTHFKRAHLWWNGLALLLMTSGLIVGPVLKNSWVVAGLATVSTLVKGWIDFRNWGTLVQLSRLAKTTYAKTLIELRTWARSGDDGDPAAFLVKMQTLDDMVTDFVPPLTDTYRRVYEAQYLYRPRPSIKVTETWAEPTIPVCLPVCLPPPVADEDETPVASTSVFGNRVSNHTHTTPASVITRQSGSNQRLE